MAGIDDKLRRGYEILDRAEDDPDLLGVALLAFHGALEDHLRETLQEESDLTEDQRHALVDRSFGWVPLVELGQQYLGITAEQRRMLLGANSVRQSFAHGEPFRGNPASVRTYARMVGNLCGQPMLGARLPERATQPIVARQELAPRSREQAGEKAAMYSRRLIAIGMGMVLLLTVVYLGYIWLVPAAPEQATSRASATTPIPTAILPTPGPRLARIVRLGGAPGGLHEQPAFDSLTLPIQLSDGLEVTLIDQPITDAAGNRWQIVSVGGYEGWCPVNNLESVP